MEDYATALRLVTGPPFSQLRDDGGTWLLEGDRIDHYLSLAVVDVAHLLATSALAAGDTTTARAAVDIARLAAPDEESPRLDAAAVDVADGRTVEARQTLREQVCNRSDDGEPPMDLPWLRYPRATAARPRPGSPSSCFRLTTQLPPSRQQPARS